MSYDAPEPQLAVLFQHALDEATTLVEVQASLLGARLSGEVGALLVRAAPVLVGGPLLALGYLLLVAASVLGLAPFVGLAGAAAALGAFHLLTGGVALASGLRRLHSRS
jgi:hypothetical protein